jgi:NADH:ubiquinone oxidoreductase subunit 6 (subunit J)
VSQVVAGTTGRPPLTVVEPVRVGAEQIGTTLLTIWAVPFEIAAVVLLVALLGSLLIAQAGTETGRV